MTKYLTSLRALQTSLQFKILGLSLLLGRLPLGHTYVQGSKFLICTHFVPSPSRLAELNQMVISSANNQNQAFTSYFPGNHYDSKFIFSS